MLLCFSSVLSKRNKPSVKGIFRQLNIAVEWLFQHEMYNIVFSFALGFLKLL